MIVVSRSWIRLYGEGRDEVGYWTYDERNVWLGWILAPFVIIALCLATFAYAAIAHAEPLGSPAANYGGGFAVLAEALGGDVVGEPLTAELPGDEPESVVQVTTAGAFYWSPIHAPTFYDPSRSARFVLAGTEVREWTGEALDPPPIVAEPSADGQTVYVRITDYRFGGVTFGCRHVSAAACWLDPMGHTFAGSTACSSNFALGTRFVVAGEMFICNDRGRLGSTGWLDLWNRPDLAAWLNSGRPDVAVRVLP